MLNCAARAQHSVVRHLRVLVRHRCFAAHLCLERSCAAFPAELMSGKYVSCGAQRYAEQKEKQNKTHLLRALASLNGAGVGAELKKSASSDPAPIAREIAVESESTALARGSEKEKKVESENALLGSPLLWRAVECGLFVSKCGVLVKEDCEIRKLTPQR